jgi:hypothetical protein
LPLAAAWNPSTGVYVLLLHSSAETVGFIVLLVIVIVFLTE